MTVTEHLLGQGILPRPERVLICLTPEFSVYCGWRCANWEHVFEADNDAAATPQVQSRLRQAVVYYQLAAELCEATPEPLREPVSKALWSLRDSDDELRELGKRARFVLTITDPLQQALAAGLLSSFHGSPGEFESTVKAAAASLNEATQGTAADYLEPKPGPMTYYVDSLQDPHMLLRLPDPLARVERWVPHRNAWVKVTGHEDEINPFKMDGRTIREDEVEGFRALVPDMSEEILDEFEIRTDA